LWVVFGNLQVAHKTVVNKSVSIGGSSSGIVITGDNNTVS